VRIFIICFKFYEAGARYTRGAPVILSAVDEVTRAMFIVNEANNLIEKGYRGSDLYKIKGMEDLFPHANPLDFMLKTDECGVKFYYKESKLVLYK
jgi:hypothetical protein